MHDRKTILATLGYGLTLAFCTASTAFAADVAGYAIGKQKELSSIPLENGQIARRIMYRIGTITDAQQGLFHGASQICLCTMIQAADGSIIQGAGGCDGIDPEGDVWWLSFTIEGDDPFLWTITGGTGKYAGLRMGGVNRIIAQHPDGTVLGRFEGNRSAQ